MGALDGKVAIVTGGTSGIGAAIAALFVGEGARVVIAGRRREAGERLAHTLGDGALFQRTDVTVEAEVEAMVACAVEKFGRLDCLVSNAGTGSQAATIDQADLARFDAAMAVHVHGVLAGLKYASRVMIPRKTGSIINVASVNGVRAGLGGLYYSVAKAAAIHLTHCAAMELGEKGIRVNTMSPGPIATGIFGKALEFPPDEADTNPQLAEAAIAAVLPRWRALPNVGRPDDVAQAALFLASDLAAGDGPQSDRRWRHRRRLAGRRRAPRPHAVPRRLPGAPIGRGRMNGARCCLCLQLP
jgi:NAD(P)-dependent dehydrogenase (short-subunit alcohol dehydrogenase family)